jgi:predicted small lipoprotein YifL
MMKKSVTIIAAILILSVLAGCGYLPGGSPIPPPPEEALQEPAVEEQEQQVAAEPELPEQPEAEPEELAAQEVIKTLAQEEMTEPEINETNQTNATNVTLEVSGSLDLQEELSLCPHLAESFSCDRYDVRRCNIGQIVGANEYYPELMNCRAGRAEKGEEPENRYCLIQECVPLHNKSVVYAYGGPILYAEYAYSEEKVPGGIMTHYTLLRCGEDHAEFNTSLKCISYKSELDNLWP